MQQLTGFRCPVNAAPARPAPRAVPIVPIPPWPCDFLKKKGEASKSIPLIMERQKRDSTQYQTHYEVNLFVINDEGQFIQGAVFFLPKLGDTTSQLQTSVIHTDPNTVPKGNTFNDDTVNYHKAQDVNIGLYQIHGHFITDI